MRALLLLAIRFYQLCLSPFFPPACRFEPTCSEYSRQALLRFGVLKGLALTAWRLLRCNPFCRGGYDPVPAGPREAAPNQPLIELSASPVPSTLRAQQE